MSTRDLASRASLPLIICTLAALTAGAMLSLSTPGQSGEATAGASVAQDGAPSAQGSAALGDQPLINPVINIADFDFDAGVTLGVGETLTVTNRDGVAHTLTSNDGLFDTGDLGGGATGSVIAPEVAGTYSFICLIHPSMSGSVTVTP